jgi:hypothetical protein
VITTEIPTGTSMADRLAEYRALKHALVGGIRSSQGRTWRRTRKKSVRYVQTPTTWQQDVALSLSVITLTTMVTVLIFLVLKVPGLLLLVCDLGASLAMLWTLWLVRDLFRL